MPIYVLIPFGVFFICCGLQFWFFKQVRDALIERHPETFLAVERSSIFPQQGLWRFAFSKRYKELGDEDLNKRVRNLRWLIVVGFVAWLCCAVAGFTAPLS